MDSKKAVRAFEGNDGDMSGLAEHLMDLSWPS
jgi:hypothetical protein